MPIKVIVFDFWQTLVSGSERTIMDDIAQKLKFKNASDFWDYCDKHLFAYRKSLPKLFEEIIKERKLDPNMLEEILEMFEKSWVSVKVYPDVEPVLKKLKGKYKLAILSNTEKETGERALEILEVKDYFDEIIFSCDEGLAKPDLRFFELILKRFKAKPGEVMFVGDHNVNDVIPAKKMGFKAILLDRTNKHPDYKEADAVIASLTQLHKYLK